MLVGPKRRMLLDSPRLLRAYPPGDAGRVWPSPTAFRWASTFLSASSGNVKDTPGCVRARRPRAAAWSRLKQGA